MMEQKYKGIDKIASLVKSRNTEELEKIIPTLHATDLAELLEKSSTDDAIYLHQLLPNETAADVLLELDDDDQQNILQHISDEDIATKLLSNMDTDDAAELIRDLDEDQQESILSLVDDVEQAGDIIDLLHYDEDTAGGVMRKEMVAINENWSMPKCVDEMRSQAEDLDELYYIYVVDDDNKLVGTLPIKKVITNPSVNRVRNVMERDPVLLHVSDTIEAVINAFDRYDLVAIPVVDSIGRLVGVITVDDVVDEMREQHEKDYQLASGISQDIESSDSVFRQTGARLPWLLIGMAGGIFNSVLLGQYDSVFAQLPALSIFIPLIGGTGGNVGMQSSAIIVQDLASNSLRPGKTLQLIVKELAVALINASIIALVVFVYNYFYIRDLVIMASVSISLFTVVLFASIFGTLVPLTLNKLKMDPARATGPFITITNDLVGMFIYMSITQLFFALLK